MTCGICLDSVGQQVDISGIWLLHKVPISQDLLSRPVGQLEPTPRQFSCSDREILKPISLTNARKPASIQEHKSDSYTLWDDSGLVSVSDRTGLPGLHDVFHAILGWSGDLFL